MLGENNKSNASTNLFVHFVGGGMAGITAASATYPLDLVRTRLAAQVTRENTLYPARTLLLMIYFIRHLWSGNLLAPYGFSV